MLGRPVVGEERSFWGAARAYLPCLHLQLSSSPYRSPHKMGDGFSSPNNLDMPLINAPVFRDIYERKHPTLLEAEGETATRVFEAMARAQKFLSPEESLAVVEVLNGTPRLLLNQYYGFIREEIAGVSLATDPPHDGPRDLLVADRRVSLRPLLFLHLHFYSHRAPLL